MVFAGKQVGEKHLQSPDVSPCQHIPLDLQISLGAGESDIDLQSLAVQSLQLDTGAGDVSVKLGGSPLTNANINSGVGKITLDLSGNWQDDATISIETGVGDLTVIVPNDAGRHRRHRSGQWQCGCRRFPDPGRILYQRCL